MARRTELAYLQVGDCAEERTWCPDCLVSSCFTFEVWALLESGVQPHGWITACVDCSRHWWNREP